MSTALVLSAGGMFAAWEAGVWKALCGRLNPDLIVGVSAGALNGWAIAGGCGTQQLIDAWMDPSAGVIGLFSPGRLHSKAQELFSRFRPRIPFALTVVEVPRMRVQLVRDSDVTWQHLAATCSVPVCFPAVRIDGKRYIDGGVMGALPIWAAEEMGATRAIAVNALTTLPFRMFRKVVRPRQASAAIEVVHIEPSTPLGSLRDAVHWSRTNVERWIAQGERDANRAVTSITM